MGLLGVDVVVEDGAFHGGEGVHLEVGGAQQFFELTHGGGGLDFEHYAADIKPLHAGHAGLLRSEYALPQKLAEGSGIGVGDKAQRRRIAVLEVALGGIWRRRCAGRGCFSTAWRAAIPLPILI